MDTQDASQMTVWQKIDYARQKPEGTICIVYVSPKEAAILLLADGEREGIGISRVAGEPQQVLRDLGLVENLNGKRGHYGVHQFTAHAFRWLEFRTRQSDDLWFDIVPNVKVHRNGAWREDLRKIAGEVLVRLAVTAYETRRGRRKTNLHT